MKQSALIVPAPQPLQALERANAVRLARAELKRKIADGDIGAAEVIVACPWEAESWPVGDLLMSQRRGGAMRCRKFLAEQRINEKKPLGDLTERQRRLLAGLLSRSRERPLLLA
jgi:hypothetical protein